MAIGSREAALASSLFRKFYSKYGISADNVEKREFGFGNFETKIAYRHMAFRSNGELKKRVVSEAPPFISFSTARYNDPAGRPLESKGWLGSELIFDLDSTDLNLQCQKVHGKSWVCSECLDAVKGETAKLVEEFLFTDFGFSKEDITLNFSGNRGYHVHVVADAIMKLTSRERKEISDYIAGIGIDPVMFFPNVGGKGKMVGPKATDPGWGGHIARGFISRLNGGAAALKELGISGQSAKKLEEHRAELIFGVSTGNWDKVDVPKKDEFWKSIISGMTISQSDSIDRNVTNDIHHLIRMAGTIHGDTGLVARKLDGYSSLSGFDPMAKCVVFRSGTLDVVVEDSPKVEIGGSTFGPYRNSKQTLPTYAALYLILKRRAVLA